MKKEFKEVQIRADYYSHIEQIIKHSGGFKNVSAYVNFVLQELLTPEDDSDAEKSKKIRQRLKELGYL